MASSLSDYLENKLIDHFLSTSSYTSPSNVYVALYTASPNDAGGGTEVSGGSYARQAATFTPSSGGSSQNTGNIDFTSMPACTVVSVGIFDALTGGNLIIYGDLSANKAVDSGDTLRFEPGELSVGLD